MLRGLTVFSMVVTTLVMIGAADASPRRRPDPDLTRADITIIVVLAVEAHLARVCGRPFDRERWFERIMADRVARHAPEAEIRAARKFWPRYVKIYDALAEKRGVNVCSTEVSNGFDNALARLRRDHPE